MFKFNNSEASAAIDIGVQQQSDDYIVAIEPTNSKVRIPIANFLLLMIFTPN